MCLLNTFNPRLSTLHNPTAFLIKRNSIEFFLKRIEIAGNQTRGSWIWKQRKANNWAMRPPPPDPPGPGFRGSYLLLLRWNCFSCSSPDLFRESATPQIFPFHSFFSHSWCKVFLSKDSISSDFYSNWLFFQSEAIFLRQQRPPLMETNVGNYVWIAAFSHIPQMPSNVLDQVLKTNV